METITRAAGISYRTRLLPQAQALAFSRCLSANPLFTEVLVHHSNRAKGAASYFVSFRPASEERQADMANRQQASREERALNEGAQYVWVLDRSARQPFFWVMSASGEVYEVDPRGHCSCPDFTFRAGPVGLKCKHLIALESGLGQQVSTPVIPERRAA